MADRPVTVASDWPANVRLSLVQAPKTTVPANSTMPPHAYTHTATATATNNTTVGVKNGSGRMDCWTALATAAPLLLHQLRVL